MMSDWKTRIENKGEVLAIKKKTKKTKLWQLTNKMLSLVNNNNEQFSV